MSRPDPTHSFHTGAVGAYETTAYESTTATIAAPRLTRSRSDSWLGGVCGGLAARYGWDPTLVRVVFVASILLPGPQFLLYLLLWLIIPREPA